ncbi:sucrase ferredoxin [Nocardioides sp.]|uniref:sucrase ferredoxin n=1 Tax=Nocardioides sp. TaxID=35761 RepID=UPI0031FE7AE5
MASARAAQQLAGTAPTEAAWLFVEYAGAWGRKAVAESRLPDEVRSFLDGLDGVRVQLIRRHRGAEGPGTRIFSADLGAVAGPVVRAAVLEDVRDVVSLDRETMEAYDDALWLVCTNGRRDVCCAEAGRPIAGALAARWPEATWETTHLGGHRFAGTLLALPSGIALGRLSAESAVAACREIAAGRVPVASSRGRAGLSGAAQFAELHIRRELGLSGLDEVVVTSVDGEEVGLHTPRGPVVVRVDSSPGELARQSCADLNTKSAPVYEVRSVPGRRRAPD